MKLRTQITLGLLSSLLAVSVATAADPSSRTKRHQYESDCYGMGMSGYMATDHVARAQKHLSELKTKLSLSKDQEPAWSDFSNQVMAQAKSAESMQEEMKKDWSDMSQRTAPELMTMMANRMKDRAQRMATMTDTVTNFYNTLTPEQKTVFDEMQMSQMGRKGYEGHMKP